MIHIKFVRGNVITSRLFKCLVILTALFLQGCTNQFLQPMRPHLLSPAEQNIDYKDVYFESKDGLLLHGWWFFAQTEEAEAARANILFLHGNAQNISTHAAGAYWLTQHGFNVFIFDYRGYGWSQGEADLGGAIGDIDAAREYILAHANGLPVYVVGHSLGASMGIYSLSRSSQGIDGAVLIAPFSEYRRVTRDMLSQHWLGWWFQWLGYLLVSGEYDPLDVVHQLDSVPKLFAYGDADRVISRDHVEALYAKAAGERYLIELTGSHNSLLAGSENQQKILAQLAQWLAKVE